MNVVVIYESRTGNTRRAAELVGGAAADEGAAVSVFPVGGIGLAELAVADVVFVGTWTDGLIIGGHRPGGARKLKAMPDLWNLRAAPFVTYAIRPGKVVERLGDLLERKGATVLAGHAFHRAHLPDGVAEFVRSTMAVVPTGS